MPKYINKLAKNNILILGGTSGIGFSVAEAAIEHGATVVISGSSNEKLQRALLRLRESYPEHKSDINGYTCDLSNTETQEENIRTLLEKATTHTKLDHVVMTAGDAFENKPISEFTADFFVRVNTVRVIGSALLGKLLPAFMVPGPKSSFTVTGGTNSNKPQPGWSLVAAVGSALEGLMRGLAVDLQPLRVNLVAPGAIHTEFFDNFGDKLPEILDVFAASTLTGVVGKPEDTAEAYIYIMKDKFITGSVIDTDGGRLLK